MFRAERLEPAWRLQGHSVSVCHEANDCMSVCQCDSVTSIVMQVLSSSASCLASLMIKHVGRLRGNVSHVGGGSSVHCSWLQVVGFTKTCTASHGHSRARKSSGIQGGQDDEVTCAMM